MEKSKIKNIIFDLGGVIINLDTRRTSEEMKKLGFSNFENSYSLLNQTGTFDLLEKGLISPDQFRYEIKKQVNNNIENQTIDNAWNAMLLDFPVRRINLIKSIKSNYRLFLLSNTNKIHYDKYSVDFYNVFGFDFNFLFEKAFYSFEIGHRKPEPDIYNHVIKHTKITPHETLFIDDSEANIRMAKSMGIQTLWIDIKNGEDVTEKLVGF